MATQDVVAAPKFTGPLHHRDRRRLLYHTEGSGIPARIAADLAKLFLGEIAALGTGPHPFRDPHQCRGQSSQALRRLLQQVKGQALGGFSPDAW